MSWKYVSKEDKLFIWSSIGIFIFTIFLSLATLGGTAWVAWKLLMHFGVI